RTVDECTRSLALLTQTHNLIIATTLCRTRIARAATLVSQARSRRRVGLHVEAELHDVAVAHDVVLAFDAGLARGAGGGQRARGDQVVVGDHLGLDEAALEVAVDDAGGLRRRRSGLDRPGPGLLRARGEEGLQAERAEPGLGQLGQAGLTQAGLGEQFRGLV